MDQVVQVGGAVLVLTAFLLVQARRIGPEARTYLILNVTGAAVLAVVAYVDRQWGFLLLEGVWALVAAWGLSRSIRRPADTRARKRA